MMVESFVFGLDLGGGGGGGEVCIVCLVSFFSFLFLLKTLPSSSIKTHSVLFCTYTYKYMYIHISSIKKIFLV